MFGTYNDNDMISIYELSRVLGRRPGCKSLDAVKLARYLIEPTGTSTVDFDQMSEERIFVVVERLSLLLGEYPLLDPKKEESLKRSLAKKFGPHMGKLKAAFQSQERTAGKVEAAALGEVAKSFDVDLTADEAIYSVYVMYQKSRDIDQLEYNTWIELLKPLCPEDVGKAEAEYQKEEFEEQKPDPQQNKAEEDYDANFEPDQEAAEVPEPEQDKPQTAEEEEKKESAEAEGADYQEKPGDKAEYVDINEDQMIEIAQNCFRAIAEQMLERKLTIRTLYGSSIYKEQVNGDATELLSSEDFLQGLKQLGMEDLEEVEQQCLVKVLAISDDDRAIRVGDLLQILEDYGVHENSGPLAAPENDTAAPPEGEQPPPQQEPEQKAPAGLDFAGLDKVSMVLMLALTEYLIKENVPLYDLLGDAVYKQAVRTKTKEKNVDVINSKDFFEVLHKMGIKTEDSEHENLRNFLALSAGHRDKIHVKKLKRAIEQFAVNEQLRAQAHDCYMELVGNDGAEEAEGEPHQEEVAPG